MDNTIQVCNPRTGTIDYFITPPSEAEITANCHHLRQAQTYWKSLDIHQRIEVLQQWKQALISEKQALIQALVEDTGRMRESVMEVDGVISSLDRWCKLAPELCLTEEKTTAIPFIQIKSQLVPYPLVGVISPWNFPFLLSLIDAIPALLAGCAVLIKPSEITPRFIKPLVKTIQSVHQLNQILAYVEGAGETGKIIIENVDAICFTGSVSTGKKVAELAAKQLIPAFLELGGKDPVIVLESADLEQATSAILWGSVINAGQSCLSIERIYVAESIQDIFVNKLVEKANQLSLNYPDLKSGEIGPIISAKQATIIAEHLLDATEKGAIINTGGRVEELNGGFWCRPTVLTQVNHRMKIMTEESFGPLMPVMSFSSPKEAIKLANDSIYGLSAAVFAASQTEALEIAQQIEAGAISINDAALTALINEGEKNSFKCSGLGGSRMGAASMQRFFRKKALLTKIQSVLDPWWY
ncbi:aldehyde dehydrogenase family protein [Limnoraphis robusta Tam1]|uniref:aldehyde dehydrogenase family protein n=1 Tax=Limnoraphis robusta TaxID=1118279 RepID=UPI002B2192C9|nr:aldehyde dehydrogenase family protein [Limnoraphis robusta]MEA5537586.1 aldehyde dehydrogenase family protein [Limnoraphis robusta Tam1]